MGHNSQTSILQRRTRCRGLFRKRLLNWTKQISNRIDISSYQQQDGARSARNAYTHTQGRDTPYAIPHHHWRNNLHEQYQNHVNMEGEPRPPEKKMEGNKQDLTSRSWYKITIPFGIKYDKKWLMNLIQSQCTVPFTPVEFHYEKMQAHFFVEDVRVAFELKGISDRIWDDNNDKISIIISSCDVPQSVQKELTSAKTEQIMLTLDKLCPHSQLTVNKQCDNSQQVLDMQRFPFDQDLMIHTSDMALICERYTASSLNIHEELMTELLPFNPNHNKPYQLFGLQDTIPMASNIETPHVYKNEVKSAWEMDKGKELEPEQIREEGSLHTTVPDKSSNIKFSEVLVAAVMMSMILDHLVSTILGEKSGLPGARIQKWANIRNCILELFPKLLSLDGQTSVRPMRCDIEAQKSLPTCKGSFFGSEMEKTLVLQFLQQYYLIYDYGDRQSLVNSYHDEACFSLTVHFSSTDPSPSSLCEYFKYNRNMKIIKDSYVRRQLLKHKKHNVVDSLCSLPKTQHDFTSFVVDMCFQTETMLCFSVSGVFKEVEESYGCVRAFTRTFITTPGSSTSLCIVNDKLLVKDAQGIPSAFFIPMLTPSSSYVPDFSLQHQALVQDFYIQSSMNLDSSEECLHDKCWDHNKATQILALPKETGTIPEETLTQMHLGS